VQVFALNRQSERAALALEELQAAATAGGSVIGVACDLQDFSSVRSAAETVLQHPRVQQEGLDVLCNNAGALVF
jgi:NAD(P)-dependent dehydrogenase (short-subunit alcohol dehydrogenase family)